MLDKLKGEDEIATILAHELAHVLAGHTDPDPAIETRKILIQLGALAAGIAVSSQVGSPNLGNNLGNLTAGLTQEVGNELLTNPYSRELELEADRVGLVLMARAGFNPHAAIDFWKFAQKDPDLGQNSAFFSTHPIAEDRIKNLLEALPYATGKLSTNNSSLKLAPKTPTYPGSSLKPKTQGSSNSKVGDSDSFDFRKNLWRTKNTAILYSSPSLNSRKRGEFRPGILVDSSDELAEWIEVQSPDKGYIQKKDLIRK